MDTHSAIKSHLETSAGRIRLLILLQTAMFEINYNYKKPRSRKIFRDEFGLKGSLLSMTDKFKAALAEHGVIFRET